MAGKVLGAEWPDLSLPRSCRNDLRMGGLPKRSYGSKTEAEEQVGKGECAYQCDNCGFWHVGHKRAGFRRGKRR